MERRRFAEDDRNLDVEAAMLAHRLMTSCAWCRRYLVGGRWIEASGAELATTHGICPSCTADLRAGGFSA
jgi:hypothetical protein